MTRGGRRPHIVTVLQRSRTNRTRVSRYQKAFVTGIGSYGNAGQELAGSAIGKPRAGEPVVGSRVSLKHQDPGASTPQSRKGCTSQLGRRDQGHTSCTALFPQPHRTGCSPPALVRTHLFTRSSELKCLSLPETPSRTHPESCVTDCLGTPSPAKLTQTAPSPCL